MFLSKITLSPAQLSNAMRHVHGGLFREHQMIWNLFQNRTDTKRDFLYRREDRPGELPFYYLLSEREPDQAGIEFDIQIREFKPAIHDGDHLTFSLRANAVVTRKIDDHSKKRRRRDIIEAKVDEYKRQFPSPNERPPPAVIHQEAAEEWMSMQGEQGGFKVDDFFVENHCFHKVKKPKDQNVRQFTSLDFRGNMMVTDTGRFIEVLEKGLGRSKAFGCGLLLVRRI